MATAEDETGRAGAAANLAVAVGYDPRFLGVPAALPGMAGTTRLDYLHFTVLQRPDRRLAGVTAVNIHGGLIVDIERRADTWRYDDRLPDMDQAGPALYSANAFDRGHLVRRRDPGWGTPAVAKAANQDTFHYTNAAPQAAVFNQSKDLWAGLENYLLEHAATYEQRLSVFTGPVLADDDPLYRGVQVPRRFWKIAAWLQGTTLAATGYVLDQTELLGPILAADTRTPPEPPPLGAYRTFQVPVRDVTTLTGMAAPALVAADVFVAAGRDLRAAPGRPWVDLTSYAAMVLA